MCSVLAFIGAPWRTSAIRQAGAFATFDPSKVAVVRAPASVAPVAPANVPQTQSAHPAASLPSAPQARSTVVWLSASGSVTGGGLIAAYCCAGAYSTIFADTPVRSGRHYWELTLSARPGAQYPDTWTNAGVAPVNSGKVPAQPVTGASVDGSSTASAIRWGQGKKYRSGDVFMFALDADNALLYYGVNGQWINGQPGAAGGERVAGSPLVAYVNVSASSSNTAPEGDRWIANFGGTAFRYPMPAGFNAYGSSAALSPAAALPGPSSAKTQSAAFKPSATSSPVVNKLFEGEIRVAEQNVPLPEGRWLGLAFFRASPGTTRGDAVALGRIERGELIGLIAINAYRHSAGAEKGFARFNACERLDYVFLSKTSNELFGNQRCWWINHAVKVWDAEPLFQAAKGVLEDQGIRLPQVLVNVGFRRADKAGFVTMFSYHVPADPALQGPSSDWASSEWHRDRISTNPARVAYVEKLREWGQGWEPVFAAYR